MDGECGKAAKTLRMNNAILAITNFLQLFWQQTIDKFEHR
jgi:hypothetical protein